MYKYKPLEKCKNNMKMQKSKKKSVRKKYTSPANELHPVEAIGKLKKSFKNQLWKKVQVQLMSFYYINVETTGKIKIQIWKKCRSPANEFLFIT